MVDEFKELHINVVFTVQNGNMKTHSLQSAMPSNPAPYCKITLGSCKICVCCKKFLSIFQNQNGQIFLSIRCGLTVIINSGIGFISLADGKENVAQRRQ